MARICSYHPQVGVSAFTVLRTDFCLYYKMAARGSRIVQRA